ncbi:hypothetical protein KR222_000862 [Zaprionus bogoriensis]|nr:hypothetical protein KR222_000862 [Zaprionus bogoriensis]
MDDLAMRVDLSNFFSDARSCSLILIDASWQNVKDLQDHIQGLFQLQDVSLLTKDGCYLPPKESIRVLKSAESLKAFKLDATAGSEERPSRRTKKRSAEAAVEPVSSTPNWPKRSKKKSATVQLEEQASQRETTLIEKELEVAAAVSEVKELSVNKSAATPAAAKQSTLRRTHNASHSNNHIVFQEEETEPRELSTTEAKQPSPKVTVEFRCLLLGLEPNVVRSFKLPRKAVPIEILENVVVIPAANGKLPETKTETVATTDAEVSAIEDVPRATTPPPPAVSPTPKKSRIEAKEATLLDDKEASAAAPSLTEQSFDVDSEDDVVVLDDTNLDDSDSDVQSVPPNRDTFVDVIRDMMQYAVPLEDLPNTGDTLIFKLLKMKGASKLAPKTAHIAGTCTYINRRTKSISISVIAYASDNKSTLLQYSQGLDDSVDSHLALSVNLKEMIEPKVVVPTVD